MKAGEQLRDYTNRFFENHNTCVSVRNDQVVDSYKKGLRDRKVFEKTHESSATKVAPLMEVVNKLIDTEEALVNQFDHDCKQDAGTTSATGDSSSKFRKRPSEVLATDGR
jgi:chaperonin GroEL (HSP60 family)